MHPGRVAPLAVRRSSRTGVDKRHGDDGDDEEEVVEEEEEELGFDELLLDDDKLMDSESVAAQAGVAALCAGLTHNSGSFLTRVCFSKGRPGFSARGVRPARADCGAGQVSGDALPVPPLPAHCCLSRRLAGGVGVGGTAVVGADIHRLGIAAAVEDRAGDGPARRANHVLPFHQVVAEEGLVVVGSLGARARGGNGVVRLRGDELAELVALAGPAAPGGLREGLGPGKPSVGVGGHGLDRIQLVAVGVAGTDAHGIDEGDHGGGAAAGEIAAGDPTLP